MFGVNRGECFALLGNRNGCSENQVSSHQFSAGASDKQLVHLKQFLVFTKFSCSCCRLACKNMNRSFLLA